VSDDKAKSDKCRIYFTDLDTEVSAINVVSKEQIASVGGRPADLKQFHQVVELTVHITADCKQARQTMKHSQFSWCTGVSKQVSRPDK